VDDKTILASGRPKASLVVRQGAQAGTTFPLTGEAVILGREEGVGITLHDPEASRQHARISWQAGNYVLEDLGSTNGTFLNGVQLTGQRPLRPGDSIGIGQTVLVFQAQAGVGPVPARPTVAAVQPVSASPPPPAAAPAASEGGGSRCLLWGCGCLILLILLLIVGVAAAAILLTPQQLQDIQRFFDENGIPIQLTLLYVTHWLA
jgi:hypothetical protein